MNLLNRLNLTLNKGLAFMSGFFLIALMLITVGEMVFRTFGHPMAGTVEMIGWLAAVITAFALGYTQIYQGHVSINLFVQRLSPRLRALVCILVDLISTLLFAIVSWHIFRHAGVLQQSGSLSETMKVIVYPWVYMVSVGCAGLTLALFVNFIKSCVHVITETPGEK